MKATSFNREIRRSMKIQNMKALGREVEVDTLTDLVDNIPVNSLKAQIDNSLILEALTKRDPNSITITWLQKASLDGDWYRHWNGTEDDRPDLERETHFVYSFPEYLEQYVVLGLSVEMPIWKGSKKTIAEAFPEWVVHKLPGGAPGERRTSLRKLHPEYSFLMEQPFMEFPPLLDEDEEMENKVEEMAIQLMVIHHFRASLTSIPLIAVRLKQVKEKLQHPELSWPLITQSLKKFLKNVRRYVPSTPINLPVAPLFNLFDETKWHANLIEKHGGLGMISFCPTPVIRYVLAKSPLMFNAPPHFYESELDKMFSDIDSHEKEVVKVNTKNLVAFRRPVPFKTDLDHTVTESLLKHLPFDLIFYTEDDVIKVSLRTDEITDPDAAEIARKREELATMERLPPPAPVRDIIRRLKCPTYHCMRHLDGITRDKVDPQPLSSPPISKRQPRKTL